MDELAGIAMRAAGRSRMLPIHHVKGPTGVMGRNSNNDLIKQVLGWAPSITLETGMKKTCDWIATCISEENKNDKELGKLYANSHVCKQADSMKQTLKYVENCQKEKMMQIRPN